MEPEELRALVVVSERAWQTLGQVSYGPTEAEQPSLVYWRSLYMVKKPPGWQRADPQQPADHPARLWLAAKVLRNAAGQTGEPGCTTGDGGGLGVCWASRGC